MTSYASGNRLLPILLISLIFSLPLDAPKRNLRLEMLSIMTLAAGVHASHRHMTGPLRVKLRRTIRKRGAKLSSKAS